METQVHQSWDIGSIILSYLISTSGSYCTIQLMEQWRLEENERQKEKFLMLSAFTLGGSGIWCMHFTGMVALTMTLSDGTELNVHFEAITTVLSLIFAIFGVYIGLKIASKDPFFLQINKAHRGEILHKYLVGTDLNTLKNKKAMGKIIQYTALFTRLGRIAIGGLFAALGVLLMHYFGMVAQRTRATMQLNFLIVFLSSIIAFGTANAAFWIIFRALTFWPQYEWLRFASACVMGIAVCGTHYTGMLAADYTASSIDYSLTTTLLLNGRTSQVIASHSALLACYWVCSAAVVVDLRKFAMEKAVVSNPTRSTMLSSDREYNHKMKSASVAVCSRSSTSAGRMSRTSERSEHNSFRVEQSEHEGEVSRLTVHDDDEGKYTEARTLPNVTVVQPLSSNGAVMGGTSDNAIHENLAQI